MRSFTSLVGLAALPLSALANIYCTAPVASTTWQGGQKISIQWQDSGDGPSLKNLSVLTVQLWTGGSTSQTLLATLGTANATKGELVTTISPSLGENGDWYFLRFRGAGRAPADDTFTARFTMTKMNGTFSAAVRAQNAAINATSSSTTTQGSKGSGPTSTTSGAILASAVTALTAKPSSSSSGKPSSATINSIPFVAPTLSTIAVGLLGLATLFI